MMSQDKNSKPGNGLRNQIDLDSTQHYTQDVNAEDVIKNLKEYVKKEELRYVQNRKAGKEFERDLKKRSKELGKPIPPALHVAMMYVYQNGVFYSGSKFFEEYKEWLR